MEFARMEQGADGARLVIQGVMASRTPWWMESGEVCAPDWFRTQVEALEGKPLTVVIDSPGGDVGCGIAIYEMLRRRKGRTRCEVIRAYSAATLAVAGCDRGQRMLSPAATLLYHNPKTCAEGDWREMDKALRFLQAMKGAVISAYQTSTGMTKEALSALMDAETTYTAEEAVAAGWADGVLDDGAGSGQAATLEGARHAVMLAEQQAVQARRAAAGHDPDEHTAERAEAARWAKTILRKG